MNFLIDELLVLSRQYSYIERVCFVMYFSVNFIDSFLSLCISWDVNVRGKLEMLTQVYVCVTYYCCVLKVCSNMCIM